LFRYHFTPPRLIEAHHGTINIACQPGGGTHLIVELPIQPSGAGV
jgi:signal transduction histidine kinase